MRQQGSLERNEGQPAPALMWWNNLFPWQTEMVRFLQRMPSAFVPPALQDWDAEDIVSSAQKNMSRAMDDMFGTRSVLARWWGGEANMPKMDMLEDEEGFVIKAELAGVDPDDLDISISDHSLTIAGEKYEEAEEGNETYLCRECLRGSFSRTVVLPERADLSEAEASFENNMLTVYVPKKEGAGKDERKLEVSGSRKEQARPRGNGSGRGKRGRPPSEARREASQTRQ